MTPDRTELIIPIWQMGRLRLRMDGSLVFFTGLKWF